MFYIFPSNTVAATYWTWDVLPVWFTPTFMKHFRCWPNGIAFMAREHGPDVQGRFWSKLESNLSEIMTDLSLEALSSPERGAAINARKQEYLKRVLTGLSVAAFGVDATTNMKMRVPHPELVPYLARHGFYREEQMEEFLRMDQIFEESALEMAIRVADPEFLTTVFNHYSHGKDPKGQNKYRLLMRELERVRNVAAEEEKSRHQERTRRETCQWWTLISGVQQEC